MEVRVVARMRSWSLANACTKFGLVVCLCVITKRTQLATQPTMSWRKFRTLPSLPLSDRSGRTTALSPKCSWFGKHKHARTLFTRMQLVLKMKKIERRAHG